MLPLVRCPKMVATSVTCCTATSTIRPLHPLSLVFISCSCHRFPCCTIDYIRSWHQLSCQGSGVMSTPSQPPANYLAARMQSKHAIASLYPNSDSSSNITISTPIERGAIAFSCHPSHFPAHLPCHNRAANCLEASHHGLLAHGAPLMALLQAFPHHSWPSGTRRQVQHQQLKKDFISNLQYGIG